MAENSKIGWTDHTFNPWIGCTKVGPGCDHCYAEALMAGRYHRVRWGAGEQRSLTSRGNWRKPLSWNRRAGRFRLKVFCASLADVFDNEVPPAWRAALWDLIRETPNLDWQLLTKRIGNTERMLPDDWGKGYPNVWLGTTVVNQAEADRDIPKLLSIPARVRFLSCEPLLGPINLANAHARHARHVLWPVNYPNGKPMVDWVIVGGESGLQARPMDVDWCLSIAEQCAHAGVAFFMKQGSTANWDDWRPDQFYRWPRELRVRDFPRVR